MAHKRLLPVLAVAAIVCTMTSMSTSANAGTPVGTGPTLGLPSTTQNFIAMGQVRLQGLAANDGAIAEVVEGVSRNAVVEVGIPSSFAGSASSPRASELNLDNGNSKLNGTANTSVKSGDCVGQWSTAGAANGFSWTWNSSTDALSVTVIRTGTGDAAFNCTLTYPQFAAGLLTTHPNWDGLQSLDVATRLTMMNAVRAIVVTPAGQTTTIADLKVDGIAVAPSSTIGPVGGVAAASADRQIADYDFDAGGSFTVSGTIASSNVLAGCAADSAADCELQLSVGHLSHPPIITGPLSVSGIEGDEATASGSFSDADGDPLLISVKAGAGAVTSDPQTGTWNWSWTPGDEETGSVTINVNDGWGNNTEHTFTYDIANAPPTITSLVGSPNPALVGSPVTWTGVATDPGGANDPLQWQFGTEPFSSASSFSTSYPTCGTFEMTATGRDDFGASDSETSSVTVYDTGVGPPLAQTAQNLVQRGQVVPVKLRVGCGTQSLSGLEPAILLRASDTLGVPDSAPDAAVAQVEASAQTDGVMRPVDGFYLYNLRVPNNSAWPAGKELTIEMYPFGLQNGSKVAVVLKLRK